MTKHMYKVIHDEIILSYLVEYRNIMHNALQEQEWQQPAFCDKLSDKTQPIPTNDLEFEH